MARKSRVDQQYAGPPLHDDGIALDELALVNVNTLSDLLEHESPSPTLLASPTASGRAVPFPRIFRHRHLRPQTQQADWAVRFDPADQSLNFIQHGFPDERLSDPFSEDLGYEWRVPHLERQPHDGPALSRNIRQHAIG